MDGGQDDLHFNQLLGKKAHCPAGAACGRRGARDRQQPGFESAVEDDLARGRLPLFALERRLQPLLDEAPLQPLKRSRNHPQRVGHIGHQPLRPVFARIQKK